MDEIIQLWVEENQQDLMYDFIDKFNYEWERFCQREYDNELMMEHET